MLGADADIVENTTDTSLNAGLYILAQCCLIESSTVMEVTQKYAVQYASQESCVGIEEVNFYFI